ncbi:uncharacterized protein LOC100897820 [Galendromus occidentalis]|uniref:Uncharacterized protein LOC100897820 n=1 Tax=Galendromus occidentalis TaxID=34638 RepID=A0AAJ6QMZ4_9ACAR|nr:uncharacterized protein LOC100897820 [Galendromus occidentalis]
MLPSQGSRDRRELFMFSDASSRAYGIVAYIREQQGAAPPSVAFILSKSKIAPVKAFTIHRLELLGALLAARMTKKILGWLDFKIDAVNIFCDNSAVLGWVASNPERWKPFVANRIRKIHQLAGQARWHYVRSEENPADILSRGADISKRSIAELWFNGPQWLRQKNSVLQAKLKSDRTSHIHGDQTQLEHERKKYIATFHVALPADQANAKRIFFEDSFSCWLKAIRFWAFMLRLKAKAQSAKMRVQMGNKCTARPKTVLNLIDPEEMITARLELIKLIQKSYFTEGILSACRNIKPESILYQYSPSIDDNGLIRCKSRLECSSQLSDSQKSPIIPRPDCNLSFLMIRYIHEKKCFHFGGVSSILNILREEFLVIHARKLARRVISACATCNIFRCQAASLPTAPLPTFRVDTAPPFFYAGCDFAGPIKYKKDSGEKGKSYILLFTCAITRAFNLHLTENMSTVEVLGALQKWEFITPKAPWFGGFYERQVQSVKRPLRKALGTAVPHFRDLEVILSNIEAMINRRPLTAVAAETDNAEALCPADLLYGYKAKCFFPQHAARPIRAIDADKVVFSRRWNYQQKILNAFWKKYQGEYLGSRRSAHRRKPIAARPLKAGDTCLLEHSNSNRAYWPLCRVFLPSLNGADFFGHGLKARGRTLQLRFTRLERYAVDAATKVSMHKVTRTSIAELLTTDISRTVSLYCVVYDVGELQTYSCRDGKVRTKRSARLVDDTRRIVTINLWSDQAHALNEKEDTVVFIRNAALREYNGKRELSTISNTVVEKADDNESPLIESLLKWYKEEGDAAEYSELII